MSDLTLTDGERDVMQVCRNGHVITDLLHRYPDRGLFHCQRCGAQTVDRCLTCGQRIPGAWYVPGLEPAGSCPPPNNCAACGAPFPWATRPHPPAMNLRAQVETLFRRLPWITRQLHWRETDRPPFRVEDQRDLVDLLRALLSLHVDEIRPSIRTPRYASGKQTDLVIAPHGLAITAKLARPELREPVITEQFREDADFYRQSPYAILMGVVYDPEELLREPAALEKAWSSRDDHFEVRCCVASFLSVANPAVRQ